ncbi:MAG: hypothetical protein ACRC35_00680 [Angustibacter sp.]
MNLVDVESRQRAMAESVAAEFKDSSWAKLKVFWSQIGGGRVMWVLTVDKAGEIGMLVPPIQLLGDFGELKAQMARPDTGTWSLVELTIDRDGSYAYDFVYDERVYWNPVDPAVPLEAPDDMPAMPEVVSWRKEFEQFPRAAEHLPDWFRSLS